MNNDIKTYFENLKNNDGFTMKSNKIITYKTGWQVADYGTECRTIKEAIEAVQKMKGNCGVWYSDGIYYVDHSMRISTKKEALKIGKEHNQISILKWSNMSLVYC